MYEAMSRRIRPRAEQIAPDLARLRVTSTRAVRDRLQALRSTRSASLKQLSEESGIPESVIGRISRGQEDPSLSEMLALVAVFGLRSIEELVSPLGSQILLAEARESVFVEETA